MKVERYGTPPPKLQVQQAAAWWLGKRAECSNCHTVVTLTESDAPAHLDAFSLRCPASGCGNYIQIRPVFDRTGRIF